MKKLYRIFIFALSIWLTACMTKKEEATQETTAILLDSTYCSYTPTIPHMDSVAFLAHYDSMATPPAIDLNMPLDKLDLSQLLIAKNTLLAMKGQLFEDAAMADFFSKKTWYQPPYWDSLYQVTLNEPEKIFIDRVNKYIDGLNKFPHKGLYDLHSVSNTFQWDDSALDHNALRMRGFYLAQGTQDMIYSIYEQNAKAHIPSVITTDLYLEQMHLLYAALENDIEGLYLTDILQQMLEKINVSLYATYEKTNKPEIERAIEESILHYAIPYAVITGKKQNLIGNHYETYIDELSKVLAGSGKGSKILKDPEFNYAIFAPSGRYAKNEKTKKYFISLSWLQKIKLNLDLKDDLYQAIVIGYVIQKNPSLQHRYHRYEELKTYFSSQREQLTLWQMADIISALKVSTFEELFSQDNLSKIENALAKAKHSNKNTISLMPVEYQNLYTDLDVISPANAEASPLALFAALGNHTADSLAAAEQTAAETKNNIQKSMMDNLLQISRQEDARSMDWMSTLLTSYNQPSRGFTVYKSAAWQTKNVMTSLASWVLLNRRINFGVRKAPPPLPINPVFVRSASQGYVVPNSPFWKNAIILLSNTKSFLSSRNVLSNDMAKNIDALMDFGAFLSDVSQKELAGETLNKAELLRIEQAGSECREMAARLAGVVHHPENYNPLISELFATVVGRSQDKYRLCGTGHPNIITACIPFQNNLCLARGGTFSYFEDPEFSRRYISASSWKKKLNVLRPPTWAERLYTNPASDSLAAMAKK